MLALFYLAATVIILGLGGYFLILDSRRMKGAFLFAKILLIGGGALAIVVLISAIV